MPTPALQERFQNEDPAAEMRSLSADGVAIADKHRPALQKFVADTAGNKDKAELAFDPLSKRCELPVLSVRVREPV